MLSFLKLSTGALLITLLLVFSSCEPNDCCTLIDTGVTIHYQTQSGENLINSSAAFDESNIKIYYKNGDAFEYVYEGNLDSPSMFRLNNQDTGALTLTVFASNFYEDARSTTLIELNEQVVDTLICEFNLGSSSEVITRAWLNGTEMDQQYLVVKK